MCRVFDLSDVREESCSLAELTDVSATNRIGHPLVNLMHPVNQRYTQLVAMCD